MLKQILPTKVVYLILAVACVMLGVIGLIIPIIPGLLFLVLAVYLVGKVSDRFRQWSHQKPVVKRMSEKFDRLGDVSPVERVKIIGLMGLEMVMSAAGSAVTFARSIKRKLE